MIDIQKSLSGIVLTKTQKERAEELYTHLCEAIKKEGYDIDFYPQGSFATRTAIKPYKNGTDQSYDVDVICEFSYNKASISSGELMDIMTNTVKKISKIKGLDYKVFDRCITVKYAEKDDVGFSIDVIPSVKESTSNITSLIKITEESSLVDTSIAIAGDSSKNLDWITNNPKGFAKWLDQILIKFDINYLEYRDKYASIEDLPNDNHPSNMIRNIIKFLKRYQDVYYDKSKSKTTSPSIIITTIVAKLSGNLHQFQTENELLIEIINQLMYTAKLFDMGSSYYEDYSLNNISKIIINNHGKWILNNPTNGKDNILNSWNENANAATEFFNCLKSLKDLMDYIQDDNISTHDREFRLLTEVSAKIPDDMKPEYTINTDPIKPWRERTIDSERK